MTRRGKPSTWLHRAATLLLLTLLAGFAARAEDAIDPTQPSLDQEPLFSIGSPIGPIEYRPGRGARFGWTGLNVGGFSTVEYEELDGETGEVALDNLNLLVLLQPTQHLRGFTEIEFDGLVAWSFDSEGYESNPTTSVERLFGDAIWNDALTGRFGKFQTPVGRWNLAPAEPFVWTPQEPVAIDTAFDEHQTGAAVLGSTYPAGGTLRYWLYGQFLDPLDPGDSPDPADRSAGARLQFDRDLQTWSLGASFLSTRKDGDWSHLVGLDASAQFGPLELTSEFVYQDGEIRERELWSIWVQGVLEVLPHVYLVGRVERFDRPGSREDAVVGDVGAAWIPVPYLHLKGSYRLADDESDDVERGVKVSLSVLF